VIAVIGCGKAKLDRAAPARELYVGQYFRACLLAAETVASGRVFILSAKYGLIKPAQVIEPYDLTVGQPGAVGAEVVYLQAAILGVESEPVTALCGARYVALIRDVWNPRLSTPLAGMGIGRQLQALARICRREGRG
jgi:hypothetical protein